MDVSAYVDLYWLPLGAGGHFVRFNGRVYEAVAARIQHRGRDELRTGEMWNSNSVISWLLARNRFDVEEIAPPAGGRAPGWSAGLAVAGRSH